MIKGGYILQPRIIDGSESSTFPPVTRELWQYLLRKVNHARNDRLNINRGQGFFRLSDIQDDLKWYSGYRKNTYSKPQLTKSLRRLREGNMVETAKETRGVLITICNYDFYQDPKNYEGNGEETAKELRRKSKGRTINKNVKEQKEEEINNKQSTANTETSLPTKDELENGSPLLTKQTIIDMTEKLYSEKLFPKVHAFKNKMLKEKMNDKAILHVLSRCYIKGITGGFDSKGAWGYCLKIMQVEDGNYNERDHNKASQ